MKQILLYNLFCWSFYIQLPAQKKFTVVYESNICTTLDSLDNPIPGTIIFRQYDHLVINDSLSYFWPDGSDKKDNSLKLPLGIAFLDYSIYSNNSSGIEVYQISPDGNSRYRIRQSWQKEDWELLNETRQVLQYRCKKARLKNTKDSVIVWYAEELPALFGPSYFRGLPGTILELVYYWSKDITYVTAKQIFPESELIIEPIAGKLITRDAFLKKFNKLWETAETVPGLNR